VNPQKTLQPVAMLGDVPNILVVPSNMGVKNWKEFIAKIMKELRILDPMTADVTEKEGLS
jgi:tripartite-type tricarboxylate transporter receptor subunit TctC